MALEPVLQDNYNQHQNQRLAKPVEQDMYGPEVVLLQFGKQYRADSK
jgi:hypothetical protein